ncbi:unnamed protein product [Rotaria socialis]|uniref:Peptidase C51 domain-containing protein n=1 Tax=Rotaria socialis TaxID=392032 RepID=A0A820FB18_9BILA|nr:unnamed protein product [Rotaria socialis]CAF3481949.1 unnamed protein product [Rotaria socialis]CAF3608640.1 unnamed protein product [Rotaria socialis]CAF3636775.1 unnamed protein product [Rotaria socialis]CAF3731201.1 unnamed protein product [Rotaria socialis]
MAQEKHKATAPFNHVQGIASTNVPCYSNGDDEFFSVEQHYFHGVFMGFKWQCVEFARRWLLIRKRCIFKNVRHASHIFNEITDIERVTDGKLFPLKSYPNGSTHKPEADSILIFSKSNEQPFGHIAIICEVLPDRVRIAEQNFDSKYWPGNYARELMMVKENEQYFLKDPEHEITGWMEIEDNHQLEPLDESEMDSILEHYQQPRPVGNLERCFIPYENDEVKEQWLDKNCPAENYFMDWYGESIARPDAKQLSYYKIDQDFLLNVGTTSNQLQRMFMAATERVINDDDLMTRFCIPKVFWSHIRRSWANDQDLQISGRFDLAFDGKQLKAFEYNADSASAMFECSIIQPKWTKAAKIECVFTGGFQMHRVLVKNWENLNLTKIVHILIGTDRDEMLTALYMQKAMNEAGIQTKLCVDNKDFFWKNGSIIDNDGQPVTFVWKLWMWETIFKDYNNAQKERAQENTNGSTWMPTDGEHPRLSDILLNDQIQVVEPLWKVIMSNKALLPVLWSMYPNHPNLLRSEWTLSDDLKHCGYAKKPIVGRCGQNVTLFKADSESVIDQTQGSFTDRDCIYQEFLHLKNFDGYYCIIGSWIIHGIFTGFCIREDQKLITDAESPVAACCIVWK